MVRGLTVVVVTWLGSAAAFGQASQLDPNTLIDALAKEGMSDLLLHMVQTEPLDDPVVAQLVEVAQQRLRFTDARLDQAQRTAALEQALATMRQLIADFYDHEQRPIWQTDLAELLLIDYLQVMHENAAQFYELGTPTAAQREAFESAAAEALEAARDADLRFFQLRTLLPREADHTEKRVNTGQWTRMIDEYYQKRTQYYLAHAAYYTALLPDESAYFRTLGSQRNAKLPQQTDTPSTERQRLLEMAITRMEPFVQDLSDVAGVRMAAVSLTGRAQWQQNQLDGAVQTLEPAINADAAALYSIEAGLAKAHVLATQKQFTAAEDAAAVIADRPAVKENLLLRLLAVDALHQVLLAKADTVAPAQRGAAEAAAYEPYMALLNDPSLGESDESLRNYVYSRWEGMLDAGDDVTSRPAVVRLAIAQTARMAGQNLAIAARQAGEPLPEQAQQKLTRAIEVSKTLQVADLSDSVRANAIYNEAVASYWLDPQGVSNLLRVTTLMTDLADQMPSQPMAEEAITNAITLLRSMHTMEPRPTGVDEAYQRTADVLLSKFPSSKAADNERLYYAYAVLMPAGEYLAAADMYNDLVPGHPDYFQAQQLRLDALQQDAVQAKGDEQAQAFQRVTREAQRLIQEAQASTSTGDQQEQVGRALAGAKLVLADVAMVQDQMQEAIDHLQGMAEQFSAYPDIVRDVSQRQIIALAQSGEMDQAAEAASAMMRAFPDDAAAVVDQVLTQIDQRIEQVRSKAAEELVADRKQTLDKQAQQLAETASSLSALLLQWAQGQGYDAGEMLAFQLIRARSLRLAGQANDAMALLQPLSADFANDAGLIHEYAETLFAVGGNDALIKAAGYYDQLIMGLQPPYPDLWWNAWMRRLQIMDKLNESTADIPLRVAQLRLTDANLGGPRFRGTFIELEAKHQQ